MYESQFTMFTPQDEYDQEFFLVMLREFPASEEGRIDALTVYYR